MTESIRVTIVATGLGNVVRTQPTLVQTGTSGGLVPPNYDDLDQPITMRTQNNEVKGADNEVPSPESEEENARIQPDILDIPAFLRRQAD